MKIINLTPHPLVFEGREPIPSHGVARCEATETEVDVIDGLPVVTTKFGAVVGLPEQPQSDVIYVVSSITAQACADRNDVFVPARPVRDEQGHIVACRALGTLYRPSATLVGNLAEVSWPFKR